MWHLLGFFYYTRILFSCIAFLFLTTSDSQVTRHLALGLVDQHFAAADASIWGWVKFSYLSFRVCVSDISWSVSNLFLTVIIFIAYISIGKWGPVVMCIFDFFFFFFFFFSFLRWVRAYLCCYNSVIRRHSFKKGVCFTVQSSIYSLLVYEYII